MYTEKVRTIFFFQREAEEDVLPPPVSPCCRSCTCKSPQSLCCYSAEPAGWEICAPAPYCSPLCPEHSLDPGARLITKERLQMAARWKVTKRKATSSEFLCFVIQRCQKENLSWGFKVKKKRCGAASRWRLVWEVQIVLKKQVRWEVGARISNKKH